MRRQKHRSADGMFIPQNCPLLSLADLHHEVNAHVSNLLHSKYMNQLTYFITGSRSPLTTLWATVPARRRYENN